MAETPYIFNIQKFSTHDGDGVRTTIFFKGCPYAVCGATTRRVSIIIRN